MTKYLLIVVLCCLSFFAKSQNNSSDVADLIKMLNNATNVSANDIKPSYEFTGDVVINITSTNKEGVKKNEGRFQYFFHKDAKERLGIKPLGVKKEEAVFIVMENGKMITLSEKSKTAVIMAFEELNQQIESINSSSSKKEIAPEFVKTGNKKVINGYECEEYVSEDAESRTICWFTDKIPFDLTAVFKSMGLGGKESIEALPSNMPQGFMMNLNHYDKKKNTFSDISASLINLNKPTTISTEGYKAMNLVDLMQENND
ncbi:MAG: hypothetical protein OHK0038_03020 [Flammeovirgaceae bacterium]